MMKNSKRIKRVFNRLFFKIIFFFLLLLLFPTSKAFCRNEVITVPLIVTDYYGWAYTEAFMDKSYVYGWSTAGVDALGWGIILTKRDYSGLFFVNVAGIAKTIYPVVQLLASSDMDTRNRAWIALGTHTLTLISLELLGKPALSIQTMVPENGGYGASLAFRF
jgi:hypothetical protein